MVATTRSCSSRAVTVFLAIMLAAPASLALGQDLEVSLGQINHPTAGYRFIAFPQVQVGVTVARLTSERHPLRVAAHWGTWKASTPASDTRCTIPCTPATGRRHVAGIRAIQTTSSGWFQPQLVLGFGYRMSPLDDNLPHIEAGLNAGFRISPAVMTVAGVSRYHPLAASADPNIRQLAFRIGVAFGLPE